MIPIENLDLLKDIDWYGFGFRDRKRIFGDNEMNWDELKKELQAYKPISIREDGLIVSNCRPKQIALIWGKPADYERVKNA